MRLRVLETGHRLFERIKLRLMGWLSGGRMSDVILTVLYRPELFGRPFADGLQSSLRGPSSWTVGERELFAAFVSKQNQCLF